MANTNQVIMLKKLNKLGRMMDSSRLEYPSTANALKITLKAKTNK